MPANGKAVPISKRAEVWVLHDAGIPLRAVAKTVGLCQATVQAVLKLDRGQIEEKVVSHLKKRLPGLMTRIAVQSGEKLAQWLEDGVGMDKTQVRDLALVTGIMVDKVVQLETAGQKQGGDTNILVLVQGRLDDSEKARLALACKPLALPTAPPEEAVVVQACPDKTGKKVARK